MAGDANNVLNDRVTAILGFAELLLEESYGSLTPEQKKVIFQVVIAAREVRDILREKKVKVVEESPPKSGAS